jgi:apolipoprotein N-acyltransferase
VKPVPVQPGGAQSSAAAHRAQAPTTAVWGLIGVALMAGLAQGASIAWPLAAPSGLADHLGWTFGAPSAGLQIMSLATLVLLLCVATTVGHAAWIGWAFGTAWLSSTFWWLFVSLHVYGGLAAPLAALAVLALAAALALYYAVAAAGTWWLRAQFFRANQAPAQVFRALAAIFFIAIGFAACWTLAELARGTWFTGFPWGAGGYAQVDSALAAWAPTVGVYGVGAVAALVAAWLALAVLAARQAAWASMGMALALAAAVSMPAALLNRMPPDAQANPRPPVSLRLLQGNIAQNEKFQAGTGIAQALGWYGQELVRASRLDVPTLIVAPETAIPLLPADLPPGYLLELQTALAQAPQNHAALVGIPLGHMAEGYTNSVIALGHAQVPGYRYDKHHLVPFGEFIPPAFGWFVRALNIPLGDFNRGPLVQPSFEFAGERFGPNICYEDLFGEELAARFVDAAQAPTVLVNVSNIAWFGDTVAVPQHLHISRMRSLELRRPMVRATNTGATAVIDAAGRVTHTLAAHTRGVLAAQVQGQDGITRYAAWASRWGLWPLGLVCATVFALAALVALRLRPR